MDILKHIKKLETERNWSDFKLGQEADIPQSSITNMFNRGTMPSMANLEKICNAFNISLAQFFTEDNDQIVLSEEEKTLILNYRNLNKKDRNIANTLITLLDDKQ